MYKRMLAIGLLALCLGCQKEQAKSPYTPPEKIKLAPLSFKAPVPERFVLSNGIEVFFIPNHEMPLMDLELFFRANKFCEPSDKRGLLSMTCSLMRAGGTKTLAPEKIEEFLDSLGAGADVTFGYEYSNARVSCLSRDFDKLAALMAAMLTQPAFDEKAFETERKSLLGEIRHRESDPNFLDDVTMKKTLFGDHPYASRASLESIAKITLEDVRKFHREYVFPDGAVMVASGNIKREELKNVLEKHFSSWKPTGKKAAAAPPVKQLATKKIIFLENDREQSGVIVGRIGHAWNAPDELPAHMMSFVLGGSFDSRLKKSLRQEKGLTYSVSSGFGSASHPGIFTIQTSTHGRTVPLALETIFHELKTMKDNGLTQKELEDTQLKLVNTFVFRFANLFDAAVGYAGQYLAGYPDDYLRNYQEHVRQVKLEDVAAAAKKYADPEQFVIVVGGTMETFERLKKFLPESKFFSAWKIELVNKNKK